MEQKSLTNGHEPHSRIESGRNRLAAWRAAQHENWFTVDRGFQRTLEFLWGSDTYREHAGPLYHFGKRVSTSVDANVRLSNESENLPLLKRFDPDGRRIEDVVYHPAYHEAGREIYGSGVMSVLAQPGHNMASLARFFLSAQNGEAGHNCPLSCTAGVIKVLQYVAAPEIRDRYLPRLLDADYARRYHGAQYLTEVQGGSDVGANETAASLLDPARSLWLLNGEKWFCSNVTADLALVTARLPDGPAGTGGLGMFLMPRHLEDGRVNNLFIRSLKDKLGTRSLATAEVEFRDAVAFLIGEPREGFRNIMVHVINTSRVYNAVACCGGARRAYFTARTFAEYRLAFGRPIMQFANVQIVLTGMRADTVAMLSGTFRLAKIWDDVELGQASPGDEKALRLLINLNKYRTAVLAHDVINSGIEILAGNGAVETLSVLPRLLRDNVVYENWEGAHGVLMAQILRDMRRYALHDAVLDLTEKMLSAITVETFKRDALQALQDVREETVALLALDDDSASYYVRPLMERLIDLFYVGSMSVEAAWEQYHKQDRSKHRLADYFFQRRVQKKGPHDMPNFADSVSRLCAERRPNKIERFTDRDDDELGSV